MRKVCIEGGTAKWFCCLLISFGSSLHIHIYPSWELEVGRDEIDIYIPQQTLGNDDVLCVYQTRKIRIRKNEMKI